MAELQVSSRTCGEPASTQGRLSMVWPASALHWRGIRPIVLAALGSGAVRRCGFASANAVASRGRHTVSCSVSLHWRASVS